MNKLAFFFQFAFFLPFLFSEPKNPMFRFMVYVCVAVCVVTGQCVFVDEGSLGAGAESRGKADLGTARMQWVLFGHVQGRHPFNSWPFRCSRDFRMWCPVPRVGPPYFLPEKQQISLDAHTLCFCSRMRSSIRLPGCR